MISMTRLKPSSELISFMTELKAVVARHKALGPVQTLAGVSQLVGTLIALQDEETMTPEQAIAVVEVNIEHGNRSTLAELAAREAPKN
jgi:hypothetical protein